MRQRSTNILVSYFFNEKQNRHNTHTHNPMNINEMRKMQTQSKRQWNINKIRTQQKKEKMRINEAEEVCNREKEYNSDFDSEYGRGWLKEINIYCN